MGSTRRVLLVGWSAADWRLLDALMAAGRLPNLAALLESGARGSLRTLQPQFDPLLWTSLATGRRADVHGVLNAMLPNQERSARPLSRLDRLCPAIWNFAGREGSRSIVVNWPITYPAEDIHGAMVSDLFFRLAGSPDGLEPLAEDVTHPPGLAAEIEELRFSPAELTAEEMNHFIKDVSGAQDANDPMLPRLAVALAESISTQTVAMELLRGEPWQLAMVRYEILDTLGPEFMACLPPQLPYIPDPIFEQYRETVPAVCAYLDMMLGALIEQAGPDTLVLLLSERGMHSDQQRPTAPEVAFQQVGDAPWYGEQGVLAINGPDVRPGATALGAGLLDIAPTVLAALGLPRPEGLPGRVLVEVFENLPERPSTASQVDSAMVRQDRPRPTLTEEQSRLARLRWEETGVLDAGFADEDDAQTAARFQRDYNLAMVFLDARRSRRALELLEHLFLQKPDDDRIRFHLARCRRNAGDLDGARALLEELVDHPDQRPQAQLHLAQLHLAAGEFDQALLCLFRTEQAEGERPGVHAQIGQVYLAMRRWEEAERAFGKALERDAEHAHSQRGMAATRLGQKRYGEAIEAALRAIDLERTSPQAHHLLGKALLADGQTGIAAQAFSTCLELNPDHADAHRGLADACLLLGDERSASEHRDRAQQLESAALLQRQLRELRQWAP